jgi:oligoendopeptidase F
MDKAKIKTEWDYSILGKIDFDLAKNDLKEFDLLVDKFVEKYSIDKSFLANEDLLLKALNDYEALSLAGESNSLIYYGLKNSKDQLDIDVKSKLNLLDDLSTKISNKLIFFDLDLGKIPLELQKVYLSSEKLIKYRYFLKGIFDSAKYLLSEKEEKILTLKSSVSYSNWVEMISTLLSQEEYELEIDGKLEKKSFQEIFNLSMNKDKNIRDNAAKIFNVILAKYLDVAEHELNSVLENKKINDELRGFSRSDESRLLHDDVDLEFITVLIKAITDNLDVSKKYYELKAKLFNVNKLEYHERNVPYGNVEKKYDIYESIDLVEKTFENLDSDFRNIFEKLFYNGQVDCFPMKGKSSGAFCWTSGFTKPTFILLNHTNELNEVLTIAHEFGHAINFELSKKQNFFDYRAPTSIAEVASTFMEDFVLQELLKDSNDELKLSLMMQKLNDDISSIFRQISCYVFELELHSLFKEKGYLSKKDIGDLFQKHMSAYMGPYVEQSKGSENWWVYWSHIRNYFYNYSYASGLLISKALQSMYKQDNSNILKIKEFLSAGNRDSPKNILLDLGIDITKEEFWLKGINEIKLLLEETEDLAKKLGKI